MALTLALLASPAIAAGEGAFQIAGTDARHARLQQAVDAIDRGSGVILIAPGTYRQCAVQSGGVIAYRARTPGTVRFDGAACEGKAALVLRGRAARVEGIIFENLAVPDGNGAGIRLETGDLTVVNSVFRNSQQGILTASWPTGAIDVSQSTFSGLGRCDGDMGCAHSLYIGDYGNLTIRKCRFEAGRGGHYVKSRARRVSIADNSFDDSRGRATNYMIDLPNGAVGEISANEMVQGADKENYSAFIALGAEGARQPSTGLTIGGNSASFAAGVRRRSAFVADWTGARISLGANRLAAGIKALERR